MANERMKATCHPDRPAKAKGLCESCYVMARRAEKKAEARAKEIADGKVEVDEETGLAKNGQPVIPIDKDEKAIFKLIMWKWINEYEASTEQKCFDESGNRDFRTEVRLRDLKAQLAMKGATILSRELITEKKEEKGALEELPGQADLMSFAKGWMAAANSSPTPRQKAGGVTSLEDDDINETFDA